MGAIASSAIDLEHVLPLPRPGGRKLFPTHRIPGLHRVGGVRSSVQLVAAGAVVGALGGAALAAAANRLSSASFPPDAVAEFVRGYEGRSGGMSTWRGSG